MDGLGWVRRVSRVSRFTWFGSVGGLILSVVNWDEDRVREGVDGEGGVGCRVD